MKSRNLLLVFFISITFACSKNNGKVVEVKKVNDSITSILKRKGSNNKKKDLETAYLLNQSKINDSIRNRNFLEISYQALKIDDTLLFKKSSKKAYNLSIKLKDTFALGDNHWNNGAYYGKKEILDSSYYHYYQAQKCFEVINHTNYSAKMLYNMAFIQSRLSDYKNAEDKVFQAISKYRLLKKELSLYKCNSLLGSIYGEMENYDNSIIYYKKALDNLSKSKNKATYRERSLNDIGVTFQINKKFNESIDYFNQALSNNSLHIKDVKLYARILDNLAYSQLLKGDTTNVESSFYKSLKIRDSLKDYSGIIINKIHLSEYYAIASDTINSISQAKEANVLANNINNKRDVLTSLLLLSKIDNANSNSHLTAFVGLKEELVKQERLLKNKFARINFETDQYIAKAEKLSLQKTILYISIVAVVLMFCLISFLIVQKAKNNELIFKSQQQQANEEIYKLLLNQQAKLEEGRLKERHRISEELHDGVLGKIFGTRIGLEFLEVEGDEDKLKKHEQYLNDIQKIEEEIRDISHELKNEILSSREDYISIIEDLITEKSEIGGFGFSINTKESSYWNDSCEDTKINIYRIIQETIQNIIKHSKAKHVNLIFSKNTKNLVLTISDNGKGFNVKNKKKGIGLSNIKSRVEKLNGKLSINSEVNIGTTTIIEIPNT